MKKYNTHWTVAAATLTVAGAMIAPQAVAHTKQALLFFQTILVTLMIT